jgi:hypothetical protein
MVKRTKRTRLSKYVDDPGPGPFQPWFEVVIRPPERKKVKRGTKRGRKVKP